MSVEINCHCNGALQRSIDDKVIPSANDAHNYNIFR